MTLTAEEVGPLIPGDRVILINPSLCKRFGVCAAAVFSQIREECEDRAILHDGKCWCVLSQDELAMLVGYSASTVRRAVKHLVQAGLLEVGRYSEDHRDRTNWYRLAERDALTGRASWL